MKRFQSAFAVPSGFAVAASAKKATAASRRGDTLARAADATGAPATIKRSARDLRDRAA